MTRGTRTLLSVAVLSAAASAQVDPVSPAGFATVEAGTSNPNPFGVTEQLARQLQIHEDLPSSPLLVRGLGFRRNADATSHAAFALELDLRMSIPITTAAAPSPSFSANHDPRGIALVVARRSVNFAAGSAATALPRPFEYVIPFDAPFTVQSRTCWELQIFSRTSSGLIPFDQVQPGTGETNPFPSVLVFGQGCVATGRTGPFRSSGSAVFDWPNATGRMTFSGTNGPSSAIAVAAIGFSNQLWAGLPLPLVIPTSGAGASGACFVWNDLFTTLAGSTGPTGTYASPFVTLSLDASRHGVTMFHHVLAFDAAANPFGMVSSDGMARQIVAPYPTPAVSLVAVRGSLGSVGSVNTGGGLVTRFQL